MKIEFDSNFNKFSFQEKLNYLEQLLNQYPLNIIVTNLIYHDNDIIEAFVVFSRCLFHSKELREKILTFIKEKKSTTLGSMVYLIKF